MGIMNEKFAGSMGRLSKTWSGMMSNMADQFMKFRLMIMKAGLFDWMKGKLSDVLATINAMEADGSLQKSASNIGNTIQTALTNIWDFAVGTYEVIQGVSGYLSTAAEYVGGWKNLSMILAAIAFAPTLIGTAAGLVQIATGLGLLSAALMANPVMLAIGLIAGGVYLIYKNWDAITPYFKAVWDGIKSAASAVWDWMKTAFAWTPMGLLVNNWGSITAFFSGLWSDVKTTTSNSWNAIKGIFTGDWLPDFSKWGVAVSNITGIDWGALVSLDALTRQGMVPESLWLNFPPPVALHDYSHLGDNYRERERIKRKKARWAEKIRRMDRQERLAIMGVLTQNTFEV